MKRKYVILATALLIILISVSLFLTLNKPSKQVVARPFYVGVEYAYGNQFGQLKALVDKVKDYTNLLVIGSVNLTFNEAVLDESCDYIFHSGLSFIVLFTSFTSYNYSIFDWMSDARQKYGNQFLGIYKIDEPGGNQLDKGSSMLINDSSIPDDASGYAEVANSYVGNLSAMLKPYFYYTDKIFTSDYGLYWFDYQSTYSCVFAEFVGNQSRQLIIALDRGAAQSFNKDWGVIINWKYDQPPYLESENELYNDLALAYSAGATYEIVFSYPNITAYGTLTQKHFDALEKFWNNIHTNPGSFGSSSAQAAYVIPADYGFGFRNPNDDIWGLFPADTLSPKVWNDTQTLLTEYGNNLNIIYNNPEIIEPTLNNYTKVFYWNQVIT